MTGAPNRRFLTVPESIFAAAVLATIVLAAFAVHSRTQKRASAIPTDASIYRSDSWTAFGGDWAANAQEIRNSSEERGAKLVTRFGPWADYQVQADMHLSEPFGEAGLIIRSSGAEEGVDAYHGYFVGIRPMDGSLEIGRSDFGWHSLVRARLPQDTNLLGRMHMRLVAVGCTIGVSVTFENGRKAGAVTNDSDCLRSGRFGLRSYRTSATWSALQISPAGAGDLRAIQQDASFTKPLSLATLESEPSGSSDLERYTSAIRAEAKKHEVQPGVTPIISFLFSPGVHPNVTIQGIVISPPPLVAIQDDSNALIVPNVDPKSSIHLGDVVEAHGTIISDRFRSRLEEANLRILWSDMPVPPLAVNASQLTSGTYRGRSIELEGTLQSVKYDAQGYELVLQDGQQQFRAVGATDFQTNLRDLKPGSRLRLRGIATSLPSFTNGLYPFAVVTYRVNVLSAPPWWSPWHIALVTVGAVALLLFIQLILHRLQKWHLRSILHEREQLALEMHDTLAQSFTGIAYQLQAASIERRGPDMTKTHIRNALQMVQLSHREASRTIAALRPQYRDAAGILSALQEIVEHLSNSGDLIITTRLTGKVTNLPLEVTDSLFRIGQEAVSNAIQHAHCTNLILSLRLGAREAQLTIEDDGRGFNESEIHAGLGLNGMRARAAKIKARFDLQTTPGTGTTISVTAAVPLSRGWIHSLRARLRPTSAHAVQR